MKRHNQSLIVLTLCSMFLFLKYIAQLYPALISDLLIQKFALTGVEVGILASSYYYSYTLMQLVSGVLLDQYDIRLPAFFAIFCVALGLYSFSHTDSFVWMCLSRVLMGVGCSFATTLYMKASTLWTSKKTFTIIASFLATATMLGAAIGSAPIAALFNCYGWKEGLTMIAVIGMFIACLSIFFVRNPQNAVSNKTVSLLDHLKAVVLSRDNLWLLIYSGITFSPVVILGGLWGVPFLKLKFNMGGNHVAILISIMFIGHALGSPVWAVISTFLNTKKPLMIFANVISFTCLVFIIYIPMSLLTGEILFFVFGFCVGCFMLSFSICREINSSMVMGFAVAFINSGEGIVSSIIDPGIGLLLDFLKPATVSVFSLQSYQYALLVLPISYVISTFIVHKLPTVRGKEHTTAPSIVTAELESIC